MDRILHCWEDGPRTDDDCGTTCLLQFEHVGPHAFTRDDDIGVIFEPPPEPVYG